MHPNKSKMQLGGIQKPCGSQGSGQKSIKNHGGGEGQAKKHEVF